MSSSQSNRQTDGLASTLHGKVLRVAYGTAELQFGELHVPEGPGPHPTVILIHGGFWRVRYRFDLMTALANDLATRGFAAWNIEYHRVGDAEGGWPGTLLDVAHAADYLRVLASTYDLDLQRVVTIGHSAGGHLALWLAGRSHIPQDSPLAETDAPLPLAGAISQAGVVDLELGWQMKLGRGAVAELLGGSPKQVPERYAAASPAALLPIGVRQVLIHGTEDESVPLEVSQAYAETALATGDQVKLIALEGVDHFALINPQSAAWATTVEALQELVEAG